jgi:chromosome segregation ATPase
MSNDELSISALRDQLKVARDAVGVEYGKFVKYRADIYENVLVARNEYNDAYKQALNNLNDATSNQSQEQDTVNGISTAISTSNDRLSTISQQIATFDSSISEYRKALATLLSTYDAEYARISQQLGESSHNLENATCESTSTKTAITQDNSFLQTEMKNLEDLNSAVKKFEELAKTAEKALNSANGQLDDVTDHLQEIEDQHVDKLSQYKNTYALLAKIELASADNDVVQTQKNLVYATDRFGEMTVELKGATENESMLTNSADTAQKTYEDSDDAWRKSQSVVEDANENFRIAGESVTNAQKRFKEATNTVLKCEEALSIANAELGDASKNTATTATTQADTLNKKVDAALKHETVTSTKTNAEEARKNAAASLSTCQSYTASLKLQCGQLQEAIVKLNTLAAAASDHKKQAEDFSEGAEFADFMADLPQWRVLDSSQDTPDEQSVDVTPEKE